MTGRTFALLSALTLCAAAGRAQTVPQGWDASGNAEWRTAGGRVSLAHRGGAGGALTWA